VFDGCPLYEANVGIKGSKVAIKIEDNIMEREG
jgi:flagellar motor switch protein FliM